MRSKLRILSSKFAKIETRCGLGVMEINRFMWLKQIMWAGIPTLRSLEHFTHTHTRTRTHTGPLVVTGCYHGLRGPVFPTLYLQSYLPVLCSQLHQDTWWRGQNWRSGFQSPSLQIQVNSAFCRHSPALAPTPPPRGPHSLPITLLP